MRLSNIRCSLQGSVLEDHVARPEEPEHDHAADEGPEFVPAVAVKVRIIVEAAAADRCLRARASKDAPPRSCRILIKDGVTQSGIVDRQVDVIEPIIELQRVCGGNDEVVERGICSLVEN